MRHRHYKRHVGEAGDDEDQCTQRDGGKGRASVEGTEDRGEPTGGDVEPDRRSVRDGWGATREDQSAAKYGQASNRECRRRNRVRWRSSRQDRSGAEIGMARLWQWRCDLEEVRPPEALDYSRLDTSSHGEIRFGPAGAAGRNIPRDT